MKLTSDTLYKVLHANGDSPIMDYAWPLPKGTKRPGAWVHTIGEPVICENGPHLCRPQDLVHWLGPVIYVAEAKGARIDSDNKIVVRSARLLQRVETWNEKTARLFACDCAERALRSVTAKHGKQDRRSWHAIKTARAFARGEASMDDLAASSAAARAASGAASRAASSAASSAASRDAARAASWAASRDASSAALSAASRDASREWQTQRLMEYLRGER